MRTYNRLQQTQKISVNQITDLCRLCMNADTSMYDIFTVSEDIQASSLASKILKYLSIEVKDNSGFPTKLCACCLKSLNAFTEFWEQCHGTNKKLHQLIENGDPSTPFQGFQSSPPYSGYDELYKSPEHPALFTADEDLTISESQTDFPPFQSNCSENTLLDNGNNTASHDPVELSGEMPIYVPSEISLFENENDASVDGKTPSKFDLVVACETNGGSDDVAVQVSMNGNSYIVKVIQQACEKDCITVSEKDRHEKGDGSQNSEVILGSCKKISYQCPHCKDSFENSSDLKTHLEVHKDAKGFICKFCFKWFSIKSGLVRHERIHSGEKPYKCDHCSSSFNQKEVLRRHVLTHSKDKPFKCDSCDKSYTQKEALKMHIKNNHVPRKLVEIMQYQCSLCEKSFCHPSGLSRHQKSHAGRKYPCKNCDKIFSDQSCLKRHNLRAHLSGNSQASGANKNSVISSGVA